MRSRSNFSASSPRPRITITFILRFAERYPWGATLALTAGTIIGCQVLFVLWLGAMLPTGTLWTDVLQ